MVNNANDSQQVSLICRENQLILVNKIKSKFANSIKLKIDILFIWFQEQTLTSTYIRACWLFSYWTFAFVIANGLKSIFFCIISKHICRLIQKCFHGNYSESIDAKMVRMSFGVYCPHTSLMVEKYDCRATKWTLCWLKNSTI